MTKINEIIKKRNNSQFLGNSISKKMANRAKTSETIYIAEQMAEIKDNELYFNASLKINLSTKEGRAIIDKMQKDNKNPLHKVLKETELKNLEEIYTKVASLEETVNQ